MNTLTVSRSSHFPVTAALFVISLIAALLATGCSQKALPEESASSNPPAESRTAEAVPTEIPEASRPMLDERGRVRPTGVSRNPGEGEALVPDVFFAFDSAELTATARKSLDQAARILKDRPTWSVIVEGHCDERGTEDYNLALGLHRANAAASYLRTRGIDAERIDTVSFGEAFPADPAHNEKAWAKNRRAHLGFEAPPALSVAE